VEDEIVGRHENPTFTFPQKTPDGCVYYFKSQLTTKEPVILSTAWQSIDRGKGQQVRDVRLIDNEVRTISLVDTSDAVLLPAPLTGVVCDSAFNRIVGRTGSGQIVFYNLSRGSCDTVPLPAIDIAGASLCGIGQYVIHPTADLLIYHVACDDSSGHYTVGFRTGIYDSASKQSSVLTIEPGRIECAVPSFSPDGRRVSLVVIDRGICVGRLEDVR
jgi:hypothetical protein